MFACAVLLPGCGGATREDRSITFSTGGGQVGFQHGQEGVFVADKEGGGLTKVFMPDKDVLAVGTPLWAPNDKRLIFTTAKKADDTTKKLNLGGDGDPAPSRDPVRRPGRLERRGTAARIAERRWGRHGHTSGSPRCGTSPAVRPTAHDSLPDDAPVDHHGRD